MEQGPMREASNMYMFIYVMRFCNNKNKPKGLQEEKAESAMVFYPKKNKWKKRHLTWISRYSENM